MVGMGCIPWGNEDQKGIRLTITQQSSLVLCLATSSAVYSFSVSDLAWPFPSDWTGGGTALVSPAAPASSAEGVPAGAAGPVEVDGGTDGEDLSPSPHENSSLTLFADGSMETVVWT